MKSLIQRKPPLIRLGSRIAFESPWMKLRVDEVQLESGEHSEFGVVERGDFVIVVAISNEHVLMVEQFRYPVGRWTLELPQGGLEQDEDPTQAAIRELREETGWSGQGFQRLGTLHEAAGFATQSGEVIQCEVRVQGKPVFDKMEAGMSSRWVALDEYARLLRQGDITDAPSIAAMALASAVRTESRRAENGSGGRPCRP